MFYTAQYDRKSLSRFYSVKQKLSDYELKLITEFRKWQKLKNDQMLSVIVHTSNVLVQSEHKVTHNRKHEIARNVLLLIYHLITQTYHDHY